MVSDELEWPQSPTMPPHHAVMPRRHPQAIPVGQEIPSHHERCYACGPKHPAGLHLRVVVGDLSVHAVFEVTDMHQGAPGLAHGGLLSTALDEALGALNWLLLVPAVTARLEVDFRRPVPVGSVLHIDATLAGQDGRKVYTRAVGRLGPDGPIALTASALFLQVPLEHFSHHGREADVQAAIAERSGPGSGLEVSP
ncbi:MAG: PaaI family thioesterase [Candidatus Nanopelagicales bacterium]|nr:PaaI family thioesterase [Candidatus Nanopelagicales bacterium]HRV67150.1 PaaI family thioesterase [Candidatus Nanopelagicales bacterium]